MRIKMDVIHDLPSLQQAFRRKQKLKFLYFWGHVPKQAGVADQAVFSQWYPAPFELAGERYATAEHYMMAEKARLFGAEAVHHQILASGSPGHAKALGRRVEGFREDVWNAQRCEIVRRGNLAKFGQHPALRAFLLQSGSRVLAEASPVDKIWGIGLTADDPRAANPLQWQGLNLLGFALMAVREELRGKGG